MKRQLTTNVPPRKIRYQHIVDDLQVIFEQKKEHEQDFKTVHALLARHYGLSQDALLLPGDPAGVPAGRGRCVSANDFKKIPLPLREGLGEG